MALTLTSKYNVFRILSESNFPRSRPLHQLAAKLTAPQQSPVGLPGAPVLNCASGTTLSLIGGGSFLMSVRHAIRNYFPKPREHKRLQFTWEKRIKTEGGRGILMRRILKGRYCIGHPPSMLPHWPHKQY